jgi:hypothetical protein
MKKLRFTEIGMTTYKQVGEVMKARGYKAMRELRDPDCSSVLTFWANGCIGTVISQVWTDTGDCCYWKAIGAHQIPTSAEMTEASSAE